jgi:hypothetical protein
MVIETCGGDPVLELSVEEMSEAWGSGVLKALSS